MKAGASIVDITPRLGAHLGGSGAGEHRPAQSVIDPLRARAVVFESTGQKVCLLSLDLVMVTQEPAARIRQAAAQRFGFDPAAVLVYALQIHSTPGCGPFMFDPDFPLDCRPGEEYLRGNESWYDDLVVERAVQAIGEACSRLQPVLLGAGKAIRHDLAFNRRGVMKDGSICMPFPRGRLYEPFGPTHVLYMEGPIDPELGMLVVQTESMRPAAMLLHYTCHPVNVFCARASYYAVSADWPGAWCDGMRAAFGEQCVPIVLNGCCGNVNPHDPFDPEAAWDHRRQGGELAATARRLVHSLSFKPADRLAWRSKRIGLDYRAVPAKRLDEVARILSANPHPKWRDDDPGRIDEAWFRAASTRSIEHCRRRMPHFQYEIQAFRIGDVAVVGLPGEPFVEGQLAIKMKSPAAFTLVAHCASQYVGYLPTRDAWARPGHETNEDCTYWAKLAPGSLERVVEETGALLGELFAIP